MYGEGRTAGEEVGDGCAAILAQGDRSLAYFWVISIRDDSSSLFVAGVEGGGGGSKGGHLIPCFKFRRLVMPHRAFFLVVKP